MIFSIGRPGAEPRMYLTTDEPESARVQCRPGEVANLVDEVPFFERERDLRSERNARLAASDWTQLADAALTDEERAAWTAYRQALRTLFDDQPDATPDTIVWPVAPGANP